jgi:hypothetical protein
MFNVFELCVIQSRTTTVIHTYFKHQSIFQVTIFGYTWQQTLWTSIFAPSSCALFHIFTSKCDCAPGQCFYKCCTQSNQQLTHSRLLHNIHCGSAALPYKVLKRRQTQETLIGRAELRNVNNINTLIFSLNFQFPFLPVWNISPRVTWV